MTRATCSSPVVSTTSSSNGGETIFPQEAEQIADGLASVRRSAAVGIDSGGPGAGDSQSFRAYLRFGRKRKAAGRRVHLEGCSFCGCWGWRPGREAPGGGGLFFGCHSRGGDVA